MRLRQAGYPLSESGASDSSASRRSKPPLRIALPMARPAPARPYALFQRGCGMPAERGASGIPILAVDTSTAARMIGMSRSHFYTAAGSGEIGPVPMRVGGKRLYSVRELQAWIDHQCPARSRWAEIWASIRDQKQESPRIGLRAPRGRAVKGRTVSVKEAT